ncbi:MAG: hypothetical protein HYT48_00090 [Candidatus Vogelbacteria bacterium]|nr:hypothetical protein [Candidatus Vogelbacteria bacterium]
MIKNKQLIEAVKNVPIIAEQEHWVITLDKEEGTLFYSPEKIPKAELHQITDEYALYLDKNLKPRGVVVEYFKENFKHHRVFDKLSKELFGGKEEVVVIDPSSNKRNDKAVTLTALLESLLIKEAGGKLIPA